MRNYTGSLVLKPQAWISLTRASSTKVTKYHLSLLFSREIYIQDRTLQHSFELRLQEYIISVLPMQHGNIWCCPTNLELGSKIYPKVSEKKTFVINQSRFSLSKVKIIHKAGI